MAGMSPAEKNQLLVTLSESPRTDFGKRAFSTQREEQKVFSAILALEGQVNNGGFMQYFESWDGDTASYAAAALRRIGADRCADIVSRALQVVSSGPLPEDRDERLELVASLDGARVAQLAALDSEFFAYPDNLTDLLFTYVAARPEVFGPVAKVESQ